MKRLRGSVADDILDRLGISLQIMLEGHSFYPEVHDLIDRANSIYASHYGEQTIRDRCAKEIEEKIEALKSLAANIKRKNTDALHETSAKLERIYDEILPEMERKRCSCRHKWEITKAFCGRGKYDFLLAFKCTKCGWYKGSIRGWLIPPDIKCPHCGQKYWHSASVPSDTCNLPAIAAQGTVIDIFRCRCGEIKIDRWMIR